LVKPAVFGVLSEQGKSPQTLISPLRRHLLVWRFNRLIFLQRYRRLLSVIRGRSVADG